MQIIRFCEIVSDGNRFQMTPTCLRCMLGHPRIDFVRSSRSTLAPSGPYLWIFEGCRQLHAPGSRLGQKCILCGRPGPERGRWICAFLERQVHATVTFKKKGKTKIDWYSSVAWRQTLRARGTPVYPHPTSWCVGEVTAASGPLAGTPWHVGYDNITPR